MQRTSVIGAWPLGNGRGQRRQLRSIDQAQGLGFSEIRRYWRWCGWASRTLLALLISGDGHRRYRRRALDGGWFLLRRYRRSGLPWRTGTVAPLARWRRTG
jgi:hypothetical protein